MGTVPKLMLSTKFLIYSPALLLCLGSFGQTDAVTCGENNCGFGTMDRCTSDGHYCRCLNKSSTPIIHQYNGYRLQACDISEEMPATFCGNEYPKVCRFGTTYTCPSNRTKCSCTDNYFRRTIVGYSLEICKQKCRPQNECPAHYQCVGGTDKNRRCECAWGNTRSHGTGECAVAPAVLTGPDSGTSAGVYMGVTIGLLSLLSLIIVGFLIRRRRSSNKSCQRTNNFSHRVADVNTNCNGDYETISLENEDQDLTCGKHEEGTVSVVHSKRETDEHRSGMKQNVTPVDKVPQSNQRVIGTAASNTFIHGIITGNGASEGQDIYSFAHEDDIVLNKNVTSDKVKKIAISNLVTSDKTLIVDDFATYNRLDVSTLNAKDKRITKKIIYTDLSTNIKGHVTSKEDLGFHSANPYFILEAFDLISDEEKGYSTHQPGHNKTPDSPLDFQTNFTLEASDQNSKSEISSSSHQTGHNKTHDSPLVPKHTSHWRHLI